MPQFAKIRGQPQVIPNQGIKRVIHRGMMRLWREAIREFIGTVINNIEVDTGMSAASLLPLSKEVGMSTILFHLIKGRNKRARFTKYEARGPDVPPAIFPEKSIDVGRILGEPAYEVYYGTQDDPRFVFTFVIAVLQWYLHEIGLSNSNPSHWRALEKGEEAMRKFITTRWTEYVPELKKFFIFGRGSTPFKSTAFRRDRRGRFIG